MRLSLDNSLRECLGELIGTFILVFFGIGSVHVAVLSGGYAGLAQVALIWGAGVALAIYSTAALSGAHLNPAVTLAFVVYRGFPCRRIALYIIAQFLGAFAAAAVLYFLFNKIIMNFELAHHILRGQPGSELSAMLYGEYFPNPSFVANGTMADSFVTPVKAMLAEGGGTALLVMFIFCVTGGSCGKSLGVLPCAVSIGLAVAIIICIVAPLTQAGLNPARDFGPRVFAYFAGWGQIAIPGPRGGFFSVYILAPVIGALAGGGIYQALIHKGCSENR